MTALLMASHIACLAAQEPGSTKGTRTPEPSSSGQDWYRPPPPEPDPRFFILPVTADRVLVPVPIPARDVAISKLAKAESVELTRADCETLGVPFEADQLLEDKIRKKEIDVKRGGRYIKQNPLNGSVFDNTYYAVEDGIAESNRAIVHLKNFKGRVRPYLVRAVAANDVHQEFYATFWRDSVTVVHRSVINNSANDPLRQHASIGDIEPAEMVKWPVVVYLEAPPADVFTRISVLKLGR